MPWFKGTGQKSLSVYFMTSQESGRQDSHQICSNGFPPLESWAKVTFTEEQAHPLGRETAVTSLGTMLVGNNAPRFFLNVIKIYF